MVESGAKEIGGDMYISTMAHFKAKKSSFFFKHNFEKKINGRT